MTALTYSALQTLAADWAHRTDLTSQMPRFIVLAERELFRELMLRNIEASTTGATSGDTIAIPDDMSSPQRIVIESAGYEYTLNYTPPASAMSLTGWVSRPSRFTIEDGLFRLFSAPDGPYTYTIYYLPELTSLSDSNTSNWLLENHEDLYLKATLLQIKKYTKALAESDRLAGEVSIALDSVKRADERKRLPVSGGLQIKPRSAR